MFDYLVGALTARSESSATLEVDGIGYRLEISANTARKLPPPEPSPALNGGPAERPLRIFVDVHTSENAQRLFGFAIPEERQLFRLLQQVRGVGPSLALGVLSQEEPDRVLDLLRRADVSRLTRIKGVGRKTAERMLVELQDRLPAETLASGAVEATEDLEAMLAAALRGLDVGGHEAEVIARQTVQEHPQERRVEELLRRALTARARGAGTR